VLCTTNINWAGTKSMVQRLVDEFGAEADGDRRCFPGPDAIVEAGARALAERARLGYRAARLDEFASAVVEKRIDLDKWDDQTIASDEIRREILAVKGFGEYATATIMALTGRYDLVPIDSAFMALVTRHHFAGERPSRKAAEAVYQSWGRWKHLAYWFERHEV
jgi:3-methyladenine DNA glycosylase/8-oxoguanine DNA glycosylase